jgi:hypothetical protein
MDFRKRIFGTSQVSSSGKQIDWPGVHSSCSRVQLDPPLVGLGRAVLVLFVAGGKQGIVARLMCKFAPRCLIIEHNFVWLADLRLP